MWKLRLRMMFMEIGNISQRDKFPDCQWNYHNYYPNVQIRIQTKCLICELADNFTTFFGSRLCCTLRDIWNDEQTSVLTVLTGSEILTQLLSCMLKTVWYVQVLDIIVKQPQIVKYSNLCYVENMSCCRQGTILHPWRCLSVVLIFRSTSFVKFLQSINKNVFLMMT